MLVAIKDSEQAGDNRPDPKPPQFAERFINRHQAEHYRDRFNKGRRLRTDQLEKTILRELGERTGHIRVVLDLPCGTGRMSRTLLEFSEKVIIADSSLAMLELAREDLADQRVSCQLTEAENISLANGSVDLVFCHRFLYHVLSKSRRTRMLGEMVRVTRRYVILSYYPPGFLNRWRKPMRLLLRRKAPEESQPSASQYCEEIQSAGLRLVHEATLRHFPVSGTFFLLERQ